MTEPPETRDPDDLSLGSLFESAVPSQAEILRRVREEAERLGEDPRAILREVRAGTPTGRFILKLMGVPATKAPPVGRKVDHERAHTIVGVVEALVRAGHSADEAHNLAPAILAERKIYGPGPRPRKLTPTSVRRVRRAWSARWFEPPSSD